MAYCIRCIGSKQYDCIILYWRAWYALCAMLHLPPFRLRKVNRWPCRLGLEFSSAVNNTQRVFRGSEDFTNYPWLERRILQLFRLYHISFLLWTNEYFMEWDGHFRNSTFPTALQTSEASAKGPAKSNVAHGWDDVANMHACIWF